MTSSSNARQLIRESLRKHPRLRAPISWVMRQMILIHELAQSAIHKESISVQNLSRLYGLCERNVSNPIEALRFLNGVLDETNVSFRSGLTLSCERAHRKLLRTLLELSDEGITLCAQNREVIAWDVDWEKGTIETPQRIRFDIESIDPLIFSETFLHDIHFTDFDLEGKVVVDIGGFVGDTALYYARKGARVYVYEPNPVNYRFLTINIALNPQLKANITPFNRAAGIHGKVKFLISQDVYGAGHVLERPLPPSSEVAEVESVTLSEILKENTIREPYLLKSDCKGCEVDLVADQAISSFSIVKIEYTLRGSTPTSLIEQLRSKGFSKFRIFKHNCGTYDLASHGTIMASK